MQTMRCFTIRVLFLALVAACSPEAGSVRLAQPRYRAEEPSYTSAAGLLQHDLGRGILFLREAPGGQDPRSDTLAIHGSPDPASEVEALFVFDQPDPHSWSYQLWSREPDLISNVLQFAYEESGLPLDSIDHRGWARVLYAQDSVATPRKGWVKLRPERVAHVLWREHIPERSLYFPSPETRMFYSAPRGQPLAISTGDDYELIPLRVEGDWMEVRIVTPSACGAASGEEIREQRAWIRYLQPDGRPRVWYYARGC